MEAKELRIGNYVNYITAKEVKTTEVTASLILELEPFSNSGSNKLSHGIPLTEECLLKFGFNRNNFNMKIKNLKLTASTRVIVSDELRCFHHKKVGYIKSVHTLQNLYFALTGEELIYNNK